MRTLALTACLLLLPSAASARSVVVVVGDAPDAVEIRAMVIEAIAERGVRLVRTPDGEVCDAEPVPCAAALATRTGADATLRVDLLDEPPRVHVRLVPAEGEPVERNAVIEGDDVEGAVVAAVGRVLDEAPPASVGFLLVRSEPAGARVEVDGVEHGTTPLRLTLLPGEHAVRLVHPTAGVHEETVEIRADEEAALRPRIGHATDPSDPGADEAGPGPTRSEPSPFNWLIGGAFAIGGVVALISPLSTIARDGECHEAIEDVGCVEVVRVGPQTGVLLGVGIAALLAAVVIDVVAPIRVEITASTTEGRIAVGGAF